MKTESPFRARINFPTNRGVPVRAYIHQAGLEEVFRTVDAAAIYFATEVAPFISQRDYDFALVTMWASTEQANGHEKADGRTKISHRHTDVFGFRGTKKWPGNPEVSNWTMTDGLFVPTYGPNANTACGDSLIVMGREEMYRRTTRNLKSFMKNPPHLGDYEPAKSF